METSKQIVAQAKEKMNKSVSTLIDKLKTLRTGQASAQQYENLSIEYYGTPTPLNQISNISVPEPRLVVIQAWDTSAIPNIEKALRSSNLSINPMSDGKLIRINVPPLTDETRNQNVKLAKEMGEEARVAIRNLRREANDKLKKLEHDGEISEDDLKSYEADVQELTDSISSDIHKKVEAKEKEITET